MAEARPGKVAETDHVLERMVFFSDAVFAIAITLLVIGIHVPDLPHGSSDSAYLHALRALTPSLAGYFISFAIVASFWVSHHRAFALARQYSSRILVFNMLLLGMIAFVPFASAFVSENLSDRVPTMLYCGVVAICGLLNCFVIWIASSSPMVSPSASAADRAAIRLRGLSLTLGSLSGLVVSYFDPDWGLFALVSVRIWLRLLSFANAQQPFVAR